MGRVHDIRYPGRKLQQIRAWNKRNKKNQKRRRRALKAGRPATLSTEDERIILEIGRATFPGEDLHLDEVVPLSKGGGFTRGNVRAIPAWMNIWKSDKLPQEVYEQLAL